MTVQRTTMATGAIFRFGCHAGSADGEEHAIATANDLRALLPCHGATLVIDPVGARLSSHEVAFGIEQVDGADPVLIIMLGGSAGTLVWRGSQQQLLAILSPS